MPWFVRLDEGIVEKPVFDQVIPAHRQWLNRLTGGDHRPSSGYWADRAGGSGAGGMVILAAANWDEAVQLMASDPLVQEGCVRWLLHEWRLVVADTNFRSPQAVSLDAAQFNNHE